MTDIKSKMAECDEVIIFRGKWETVIEDDRIPLSLIVARVGANVRSPLLFLFEPNHYGGGRVSPFVSLVKPPDDLGGDLIEMDVELMTISAPKALIQSLGMFSSDEIVLVGMADAFEVYPRDVWTQIEREEVANSEMNQ